MSFCQGRSKRRDCRNNARMDSWNPILVSSLAPEIEELHASIRDRVSVGIAAFVGVSMLIGWLLV